MVQFTMIRRNTVCQNPEEHQYLINELKKSEKRLRNEIEENP